MPSFVNICLLVQKSSGVPTYRSSRGRHFHAHLRSVQSYRINRLAFFAFGSYFQVQSTEHLMIRTEVGVSGAVQGISVYV
jgi:hypothetical protein